MKIAVVRGDFAAPSEFINLLPLTRKNKIAIFTGFFPVWDLSTLNKFKIIKSLTPVDLNFGKISRFRMSILNRIFTDAHYLLGLEQRLKGYDIAYCAETYFNFTQQSISAKRKGYVKKVVSIVWENIPHNNEGIAGRLEFKKNAFKNIDLFLAVTNQAKTALIEEGCDSKKIVVLKPGIDLKEFRPGKNTSKNVRILFVGRLIKEKGILEILEIYKSITNQIQNVELVICGTGPLLKEIEAKIKKERIKNVKVNRYVPYTQMPKIFSSSDIFVHYPIGSETWKEQYGMVLLEALASGLAVIALDRGSIREVIGDGGIIVNEKNFKKELKTIIVDKDKQSAFKKKSRSYALKNYDASEYAKKLERIYNDLLKQ